MQTAAQISVRYSGLLGSKLRIGVKVIDHLSCFNISIFWSAKCTAVAQQPRELKGGSVSPPVDVDQCRHSGIGCQMIHLVREV